MFHHQISVLISVLHVRATRLPNFILFDLFTRISGETEI